MSKRFEIDWDYEQLVDNLGVMPIIDFNDKIDFYELCVFLNDLNDRADRNAEKYLAFLKVLDKYGIGSVEKLDYCLREQRVW